MGKNKSKGVMEYIFNKYYKGNPKALAKLAKAREEAELARTIYLLRTGAFMTKGALAKLVGVPKSAIQSLEDADYGKGMLALANKIKKAIKLRDN